MSKGHTSFPYVVNDAYSLGYWLKDYGYYPRGMPLFTYMDHGVTLFDYIPAHELENDAPVMFKNSPRLTEVYKTKSKKPVYNVLNPAIHYRISHHIEKSESASGSLFFVAHSTRDIDDQTNWEEFIKSLEAIPDIYKPIDVCLHPVELEKGVDHIFRDYGFNVVSAGKANSTEFIKNFYSILRRYNFVLSNIIGSYTFYSVEMNIPFSLFGSEPKFFNKGDDNIEKGVYQSYKQQKAFQQATNLFNGFHTVVTKEQKEFVEWELGKHTTISRRKAAYVLYKAMFVYLARHPKHIRHLKNLLGMQIKERYKIGYRIIRNFYLRSKQKEGQRKPLLKLGKWEEKVINHLNNQGIKTGNLGGRKIKFLEPYWFLHNYKEIFEEEVYFFESENKKPRIIDCGSNIGLSILYFKKLFPGSIITGFEPNPEMYDLLKSNLAAFDINDVDVRNEAIWIKNETLSFQKGYLEGHIVSEHDKSSNVIHVKAVRLKELLAQHDTIDFLKMDIEGAELEVIKDSVDYLPRVTNFFIEFHNKGGQYCNELTQLLSILEKSGFYYYMKDAYEFIKYPFAKDIKNTFDQYHNSLNIFAFRK